MKIGLIARSDDRGLGLQAWEIYRHLQPAKTVLIDMAHLSPYPNHPERYPDAWATWSALPDGTFRVPHDQIRRFLDGLDVVLAIETPYDYCVYTLAREMGVRSAVQYNHEFLRHTTDTALPRPDLLISPSTWHLDDVPGAVYLPLPVDRERCRYRHRTAARTFLHVAGHRTNLDRNGTRIVMEAAGYVTTPVHIVIRSQSPLGWDSWMGRPAVAKCDIYSDDYPVANYWDLYDEADMLLLPRKFGGQSMQMSEALSCGVVPIMSDMEPQRSFLPPECLVARGQCYEAPMQSGPVDVCEVNPQALARRIDVLAGDDPLVSGLSKWADEWADAHSWDALLPRWFETLESVVNAPTG